MFRFAATLSYIAIYPCYFGQFIEITTAGLNLILFSLYRF
jgi:hypothetical protein